jgi:hypothetical protein
VRSAADEVHAGERVGAELPDGEGRTAACHLATEARLDARAVGERRIHERLRDGEEFPAALRELDRETVELKLVEHEVRREVLVT